MNDWSEFSFAACDEKSSNILRSLFPGCHAKEEEHATWEKNPDSKVWVFIRPITKTAFHYLEELMSTPALGQTLEDALIAAAHRKSRVIMHINECIVSDEIFGNYADGSPKTPIYNNSRIIREDHDDYEVCFSHSRSKDGEEFITIDIWRRADREDLLIP